MRLVIDLQGAQTASRHRGIGRYSVSLAQALVRNRGEHEVIIALNGLFSDTIEPIRAAFDGLLSQENIRVWNVPGRVMEQEIDNQIRRQVAELVRESFLASLQPDAIWVSSLFEGYGDDAVTSVGLLDTQTPVCVTIYDLIPLLNPNQYLNPYPIYADYYRRKISHLTRADMLWGISRSAGQEAIEHLGSDPASVIVVGTASDDRFCRTSISSEVEERLRNRFGLNRAFLMYSGATDERKNHLRLIEAYASLPAAVRNTHQLVFVGSLPDDHRARFERQALNCGLHPYEFIITGHVSDEDMNGLYNLCKAFVFPSWHEGFGLPALEAMQCGKAVIASNTSSLPEVVGYEDALFDPFDAHAMAKKIEQVLSDDEFRAELERHGLEQARQFSWDVSARSAWQALEAKIVRGKEAVAPLSRRPRLAYVSPLPPEASGISGYSAELLPELARHYRIEVIVAQDQVADPWVHANCPIRDVAWFRRHAREFDRVLYHFGNSHFHSHMFGLLSDHPGVVVLHDFFLSGIIAHRDVTGENPHGWAKSLLESHGWAALAARFQAGDTADVVYTYPCNLQVLQDALGVIVHADYSRRLAREWYGDRAADHWSLIPLLRQPATSLVRAAARRQLGVAEDDFVVCSFGLLDPTKQNHRLLAAWQASPLAQDTQCRLVFVGQNHGGEYGAELVRNIRAVVGGNRIEITGWADTAVFRQWLVAADVGVQLRTLSRGETSAAVLDCMNYGLATIVNANGSMAELPENAVWMLPDEFDDEQLIDALRVLWTDRQRRAELGQRAREVIMARHNPRRCAALYTEAIEGHYQRTRVTTPGLMAAIAGLEPTLPKAEWPSLAASLAKNMPPHPRCKQLLVDVSALVLNDLRTGIERVVRSILAGWLLDPPSGWIVEPVYATTDAGYRYARCFTNRFLEMPDGSVTDDKVEVYEADVFVGLDLQQHVVPRQLNVLQEWHQRGVSIQFVVYDLLPVLRPDVFPDGARGDHHRWLETVTRFDGAICISRAVADELQDWLQAFGPKRDRLFALSYFHLGADTENSVPTRGFPANAEQVIGAIQGKPTFLMVGTIEPRKGYLQTIAAFDALWASGVDVNLVIVGHEGWKGLPDGHRRTIPNIVAQLRSHPKLETSLFWLEGISDEYLEKIYAASTCLISVSEGEGFGLPLIEAAQHGLPMIVRDIPVFREVAGEHAFYFADDNDPQVLASAVQAWLALSRVGRVPQSGTMPWLTWAQSAEALLDCVLGRKPAYRQWRPDGGLRFWGNDPRLHTQVGKPRGCRMHTSGQSGFLVFGPYLPLAAGRYCLRAWGGAKHLLGTEYLDMASSGGEQQHCHALVLASDDGWRIEVVVELPSKLSEFEIRVWVDAGSELWLDGIEFIPAELMERVGLTAKACSVDEASCEVLPEPPPMSAAEVDCEAIAILVEPDPSSVTRHIASSRNKEAPTAKRNKRKRR